MNLFNATDAIWWAILALGGVAAAMIGRRGNKLAVIGVFFVAWIVCAVYEIERRSYPIGRIDEVEIWVMAAIMAFVAMVPMLFVAGKVSLGGGALCGIFGATIAVYGLQMLLIALAAKVPVQQHPCNLPILEASIPSRTLEEIGTVGFFSARCPVPVATEVEFDRDYGVLGMRWRMANHSLYAFGRTADGQSLSIGGGRFNKIYSTRWSPGPEYSHVMDFGQRYSGSYAPATRALVRPETFSLTVSRADGEQLEEIELSYGSRPCTCAYYLGLFHGGFRLP